MAGFAAGSYRTSPGRGTSPGFRFTLYAILAIALMFADQRRGWLVEARYYLSAAAYPLQLAVSSPSAAWRWLESTFEERATLQADNAALLDRVRSLELKTQRFEALARENGELRGLKSALPSVADRWLVAEVVGVELNSLRQRILIDRGARNGVFDGQSVMDSHGLLGQTMRVGPWSAEVILLTDPEHAVPVEIERTGVRTIAVGTGDRDSLALPYLPINSDVKAGDLLVTSGLGGVFPQGYPVARITSVRHDAVSPLAQIRARPLAGLDRLHEVMLVWFRGTHPAAPLPPGSGSSVSAGLPAGDPAFQPQEVPLLIAPAAAVAKRSAAKPAAHQPASARPARAKPAARKAALAKPRPAKPASPASGRQP
ncbi:MAG: rod shape-determining protein MreC [Steroidobacteraceae bacterium]